MSDVYGLGHNRVRYGGYRDVKTTMIHTHVLDRRPCGVRSPVDEP